jgi:RHS repeat-associated protein
MSFDVFGARRDAQSWALKHTEASSGLLSSALTLRSYTGHEQIDDVCLVHMGGRVYDPILGRFLQADPFVQQPNNTQNLNRYSYVLNNPLNATDPSGYFFQMLVMWAVQYIAAATASSAIGTALGIALQAYQYYGYAQMAVGAIRAIEGGGTAMANFAGGMAKGYAKSMLFNGAMNGLSQLAGGQRPANSPDAPQEVDSTQGSASADGYGSVNKGNAPLLGGGADLTTEERQAVFDQAKAELLKDGLIRPDDNIKYVDKFALAKLNDQGLITPENFRSFASLDEMYDFKLSDEGRGFDYLNGSNPLGTSGSRHIQTIIYAGATNEGLRGYRGVAGLYDLDSVTSVKFTILHEQAHGLGIRPEGQASGHAIEKLKLQCKRACP